jgi:hypothetical protein
MMTTIAPMASAHIPSSTTSNRCLSRRLYVTLSYFIISIHFYDALIRRTVSFTFNTPSYAKFSVPHDNRQQLIRHHTPIPQSHNNNKVGHLHAIAIPTTSVTDTYVNGYSSLVEQQQQQQQQQPNVGVLLLNLGGPETGDDVEGMLHKVVVIAIGVDT